jgi:YVTN family beta-propeller protein
MDYKVRKAFLAAAMTLAGVSGVGADTVSATVATHTVPRAIAVDSVTDKIYVADDSFVTVIDGATNTSTSLAVGIGGASSNSIAVDPVTNMVYVANKSGNSVTVINGAVGSTAATVATTISVGTSPVAVAVNSVTDMIYVANYGSNSVTVINGANNFESTVNVGTEPVALAVNPVTGMIYVANYGGTITIIEGSNNATATLAGGYEPFAIAVNSATDKIYVANYGTAGTNSTVTVIDGATNSSAAAVADTVSVGIAPCAIAVDQSTDMIYVANSGSGFVTAINGATTTATAITGVGANCLAAAVNPATNIVYLANNSGTAVIVNGTTNSATSLTAGTNPAAVAVNTVTDMIYVANEGSASVTVITGPGPGQPVLSSPSNGATGQMSTLTLSWNSVSGATSYTVQVSTGSNFSNTVVNQSAAGLSATVGGLVYGGTGYYWRVGAVNTSGTDWSYTWSLVTLTVPAAPVLATPINGLLFTAGADYDLTWNEAANATSYTCQISTASSFANTIISQSNILPSVSEPPYCYIGGNITITYQNLKIYWHVNASNAAGSGAWSSTWSLNPTHPISVKSSLMHKVYNDFSIKNGAIVYSLSQMEEVDLSICDMLGRTALFFNRRQATGSYSIDLKSSTLAAGMYMVRFKAGVFEKQVFVLLNR